MANNDLLDLLSLFSSAVSVMSFDVGPTSFVVMDINIWVESLCSSMPRQVHAHACEQPAEVGRFWI